MGPLRLRSPGFALAAKAETQRFCPTALPDFWLIKNCQVPGLDPVITRRFKAFDWVRALKLGRAALAEFDRKHPVH